MFYKEPEKLEKISININLETLMDKNYIQDLIGGGGKLKLWYGMLKKLFGF